MTVGKIPFTNGFAIVDVEDVLPTLFFSTGWYKQQEYVVCRKKGEIVYLHLFIAKRMGLQGSIDHENRNQLDNRRENLREATRGQNKANSTTTAKSGFRGVHKNGNGWHSQINYEGEVHYLGLYSTPEAAAKAYDLVAKEKFGDFATLNFPEDK